MNWSLLTKIVIPLVSILVVLGSAAEAACPTQPTSLMATGGKLSICSDEATTAVEIERNGVVQPTLPIALVPGVVVNLSGYLQCGAGTLKVRGVNAAGAGPWGGTVSATFPGCLSPVLGNPLP